MDLIILQWNSRGKANISVKTGFKMSIPITPSSNRANKCKKIPLRLLKERKNERLRAHNHLSFSHENKLKRRGELMSAKHTRHAGSRCRWNSVHSRVHWLSTSPAIRPSHAKDPTSLSGLTSWCKDTETKIAWHEFATLSRHPQLHLFFEQAKLLFLQNRKLFPMTHN